MIKPRPAQFSSHAKRQRGAASLLVVLMLLVSISLVSFSVARVGKMEQRITSNDYRAREASAAAQAGVEFAQAWLAENSPVWVAAGGIETSAPGVAVPPITAGNSDIYTVTTQYTRTIANSSYILITATARAAADGNITASAQAYSRVLSLLDDPGLNTPPIMLDGCLSNVTGNPDVYPEGYGGGGIIGDAIATSRPASVGGTDCIDNGHLGLNGGTVQNDAFTGDLWDQLFNATRAEVKAVADAEVAAGVADADRTVIWETSSSNYHSSWGSPTKPVILVFAPSADCPKINGGQVIYGVVFVDSDCLGANGFGGLEVFGTVAVNGDISKLTANSEFSHFSLSGGGGVTVGVIGAGLVLGSWKDF